MLDDGTELLGERHQVGCDTFEILVADVKDKVERIPTVRAVDVQLVFDPPWDQSMMTEAARLQTGMF